MAPTTLKERCFALTGSLEGSGYGALSGNFDGEGLSFGILQWCFGQGTLQPLIKAMYAAGPETFARCCTVDVQGKGVKDLSQDLIAVCDLPAGAGVHWAWQRMRDDQQWFAPAYEYWVTVFRNLGADPGFQAVQRQHGAPYWQAAVRNAQHYQVATERGVALCFDIAVQNGCAKIGPGGEGDTAWIFNARGGMDVGPHDRLANLAAAVALTSAPRWSADVFARKMAIACGCGRGHTASWGKASVLLTLCGHAHGRFVDLQAYGIGDGPAAL